MEGGQELLRQAGVPKLRANSKSNLSPHLPYKQDPHSLIPTPWPHSCHSSASPYSFLQPRGGHSDVLPVPRTRQALAGLYASAHAANSGVNSHEFCFLLNFIKCCLHLLFKILFCPCSTKLFSASRQLYTLFLPRKHVHAISSSLSLYVLTPSYPLVVG